MKQKTRVGIRGATGHFATNLLARMRKCDDIVPAVGIVRDDPGLWRTIEAITGAPAAKRKALRDFYPKLMVLESEANGVRDRVREINATQSARGGGFEFVPACDFDPKAECDVLVDLTRGAKKPVEVQYESFARERPVIVTLDTGKEETLRGRLIAPPFVESGRDGNLWRLGDCVLSAVFCLLSKVKENLGGRITRMGTTVFCILDSKINDNFILPERAHALYLRAPPADLVESCLKWDMERIFSGSEVEKPVIVQAHGLNYYALIIRLSVSGAEVARNDVLEMLSQGPHVLLAPESVTSTFDIDFGVRRLLGTVGDDLPPFIPFSNSVEAERAREGTNITIRAAVRYADVGPVMCLDAVRALSRSSSCKA